MTENIEVFTQSSIRVRDGERTVYLDPYEMREEPHDADVILITHDHFDHFSVEDIAKVAGPAAVLVVPEKMGAKAREAKGLVREIVTVRPGERREVFGLNFETVPAYNVSKPFHPRSAGWVGYVLEVGGRRVYAAGDTDATEEARRVRCDVALVPVGGTYTMDARAAAELVNEIRPEVAIPIHYGSVAGGKGEGKAFAGYVREPVRVEEKIAF